MTNIFSNFDNNITPNGHPKLIKNVQNNFQNDIEMIKARNALLSDKDDDISESLSSSSENSSSRIFKH
jgi:hypothetical protein